MLTLTLVDRFFATHSDYSTEREAIDAMNANEDNSNKEEGFQDVASFEGGPFGKVFFTDAGIVLFQADCPPFGQLLVKLVTWAVRLEYSKNPIEGTNDVRFTSTKVLDLEAVMPDLEKLTFLESAWIIVWPALLQGLTEERSKFDLGMQISPTLSITLPGEDQTDEGWICAINIPEESGRWEAMFKLNGEIQESVSNWQDI